jgi:hypothetical protein
VQPRDNSGDSPARFLAELRALRAQSALSHADLAARAHYPIDLLQSAEVGPSLPDLPVLSAYVRGCGGETADWEDRWRMLSGIPTLSLSDGLPSRPSGGSAAASAGAAAGVYNGPVDERESAFIMSVLARVTAAASTSSTTPAAPAPSVSPEPPVSPVAPASPDLPDSPVFPVSPGLPDSPVLPSDAPATPPSVNVPDSPAWAPASPEPVFTSPSVFEPISPAFPPVPARDELTWTRADPTVAGASSPTGADSGPVWPPATFPADIPVTRSNGSSQVNGYRPPPAPPSHASTSGGTGLLDAIPKQARLPLLVGVVVVVLAILITILV